MKQEKDPIGRRYEIIVKPEVGIVVYILKTRFGKFKGVARCIAPDVFDRDTGVQIAYAKAKVKELRVREREIEFFRKQMYENLDVLQKKEDKVFSEYKRLDSMLELIDVL